VNGVLASDGLMLILTWPRSSAGKSARKRTAEYLNRWQCARWFSRRGQIDREMTGIAAALLRLLVSSWAVSWLSSGL